MRNMYILYMYHVRQYNNLNVVIIEFIGADK